MSEQRIICGYQPAPLGANPARWRRGETIAYRISLSQCGGVDREKFREVFRQACDSWENVCGIKFQEVESRERVQVFTMQQQPGGVLADAELPYWQGRTKPLAMRYDVAEPWAVGTPVPSNRIGLRIVTEHELGHILGLDHGGDTLMAPYYDPRMVIGEWERRLVVDAYGPPQPKAPQQGESGFPSGSILNVVVRDGRLVIQRHPSIEVEDLK
jgi:hypothetical protein